MKRGANQQVSPKTAAVLILGTLIVIQGVWWKGLVAKTPPPKRPDMMGPMGTPPPVPPTLMGKQELTVNTFAGSLAPGDEDGPGNRARFDSPTGIAIDSQGVLYVADSRNHRIRTLSPQGKVTTLAGSEAGYADGPVGQAKFYLPCGVAVAQDGAVYVADTGNHRIRKIKDGKVTTLAGGEPGMADGAGSVARFHSPSALALEEGATPRLFVADTLNQKVRILDLAGNITGGWAVAGAPTGVLAKEGGIAAVPQLGFALANGKTLPKTPLAKDGLAGKPDTFVFRRPVAFCPAPEGFFAVSADHCGVFWIKKGVAEILAGQCKADGRIHGLKDAPGHRALFGRLGGVAWNGKGRIYVSDTSNNSIRLIDMP